MMSSRSAGRRPTKIEEQAHLEAVQYFGEQLTELPVNRDHVKRLERDIAKIALAAMAASRKMPHGEPVQADDGLQWYKSVELFEHVFVCHRQTMDTTEFAIIEGFPSGLHEIWIKGRNAVEVVKAFTHDQRHALQIWMEDIQTQVKEFLAAKYPGENLSHVSDSFVHRLDQG